MTPSESVMAHLASGVPLTLLCDLAGWGPTPEELLLEERPAEVSSVAAERLIRALRPAGSAALSSAS